LSDCIKRWAEKEMGIPSCRVMLAATHSHSSPQLLSGSPFYGAFDLDYFTFVEKRIRLSLKEAVSHSRQGSIVAKRKRLANASVVNRILFTFSFQKLQKIYVRAPNRHRYADDSIHLAYIYDRREKLMGILIGMSCHPVFHISNYFSADWPGALRQKIKSNLGDDIFVLFLQGFCGDLRPAFYDHSLKHWFISLFRYGKPVQRFLYDIEDKMDEFVNPIAKQISFPSIQNGNNDGMRVPKRPVAREVSIHPYGGGESVAEDDRILLHRLDIPNGVILLGIGAEVFSKYAQYIYSLLADGDAVWPVGYANEMFGYVPDDFILRRGIGYEHQSFRNYGRKGPLPSNFFDTLTESIGKIVNEG